MKMTTLFLFALINLTLCTNAQNSGWETGVNVSAGVSDLFFTRGEKYSENPYFLENYKDFTNPSLYYSAGVYGRKFFKTQYGVEIGINYSSFSQRNVNTELWAPSGPIEGKVKVFYRQNFVDIPVRFVFKKDFKMVSVGCFAGVAPSFLTHATNHFYAKYDEGAGTVETENTHKETSSYNTFNLMVDAGMLIRFNVHPNVAIDAKPFFRSCVLTHNSFNDYFNMLPYTAGLSISTVWKF